MSENHSTQSNDARRGGHEPDVVNARTLIISGTGLVLLVPIVLLLIYVATRLLASQMPSEAGQAPSIQPTRMTSGPQFTAQQPQLLHELRESEQERLTTYQWIDEQAGIARIPIDRAVDILAKKWLLMQEPGSRKHDDNRSE